MTQVIRVFPDTDLRCGHHGLAMLARKEKLDPQSLLPGEFLVFLNTRKTAFKLYAANEVIAYYRSPEKRRIELQALQYIPQAFQSKGRLKFDDALRELLKRRIS